MFYAARWSRIAAPVAVLILGALITFFAWHTTKERIRLAQQAGLQVRAGAVALTLRDRLLTYEAVLHAGVGLIRSSDQVEADEWATFAGELQVSTSYPGLQGIGFARRTVKASDSPLRDGRDHTEIVFLEPLDERNRRAIGFDMMTETVRRTAMERARDNAVATLTSKVTLIQEITVDRQAGFLFYAPVYSTETPRTVEERRERLLGFVYCPFRAGDFVEAVLRDQLAQIHVEVRDAQSPDDGVLFSTQGSMPENADQIASRNLDLFGGRWNVRVWTRPGFVTAQRSSRPLWVAVIGATTTALLAGLVWLLASSRQHLAARLVAEDVATQRERYAAAVLEHSIDAYVGIDSEDRIIEWNAQAAATFGWTKQEALGMRLAETIVPPAHRAAHLKAISNFDSRAHRLLDRRIEMPAFSKEGLELRVELSIFPTVRGDQRIFIASLRDVTEQRKQQAQVASLNATLERRVEDRTQELERANQELHTLNAQLESFAQNVSHDLRAPLRAAGAYAQMAMEESGDTLPPTAREHLNAVAQNIHRMQQLTDGLLKLAFISRQTLDKRMVNLWTIVLSVINDLHVEKLPAIHAKPDELGEVFADPNMLTHALRNLIANAIKFGQHAEHPTVSVGAEVQNGERVFYVRDNGVGFDEKHAAQLFKAFHRLHRSEEFEGTGIGLTIVRSVIERHGGRVWAHSSPNNGATFFFTLPLR